VPTGRAAACRGVHRGWRRVADCPPTTILGNAARPSALLSLTADKVRVVMTQQAIGDSTRSALSLSAAPPRQALIQTTGGN